MKKNNMSNMSKEKRYEFTVKLSGEGATEEEAWHAAIEAFLINPSAPVAIICHDEEIPDEFNDSLLRHIITQCTDL
jgi:hypothetical protein